MVAATASAQRYNPELPWSQRGADPRIAHLGDKLRHLRQLVLAQLAQLAQTPESDSFVRDEEGSGSGHDGEAQWTTDDEDRNPVPWSEQGSGSGDEPIGEQMRYIKRGVLSACFRIPIRLLILLFFLFFS